MVSRDERESGLREILNFGHMFAHALESVTRYRKYLHGEAVGWGMIAAAKLAVANGMFSPRDAGRLTGLIARVGPLPSWPDVSAARLITAMQADKKTRAGRLRFVLPQRIGKVRCGVKLIRRYCSRSCASALPRAPGNDPCFATRPSGYAARRDTRRSRSRRPVREMFGRIARDTTC